MLDVERLLTREIFVKTKLLVCELFFVLTSPTSYTSLNVPLYLTWIEAPPPKRKKERFP